MSQRVMYLRKDAINDQLRGEPCGCVVIEAEPGKKEISYGFSFLNPKDTFDRSLARSIAAGRLRKHPIQVNLNSDIQNLHEVSMLVMQDLLSREVLFTNKNKDWGLPKHIKQVVETWISERAAMDHIKKVFSDQNLST